MKIIVPMAGMGKRMRPHTLTVPKPLLPIAGKTIVERLVIQISEICNEPIEEVVFVISPNFGEAIERQLQGVAAQIGAKGAIAYQKEALGTAHAIQCAGDALRDRIIIAFADTLFEADFAFDPEADGMLWVKQIEDPRQFGVVTVDEQGVINQFVEKPETFVSDMAIIGIYYVKDGARLREEIQYLLDNDIKDKGEYQLTNALDNMKNKGYRFKPAPVNRWMDCGNKNATVDTNAQILEVRKDAAGTAGSAKLTDAVVVQPCYIGEGVVIERSVVGPYVSLEANARVSDSRLSQSIVMEHSVVANAVLHNTMVGKHVQYHPSPVDASVGDYTQVRSS